MAARNMWDTCIVSTKSRRLHSRMYLSITYSSSFTYLFTCHLLIRTCMLTLLCCTVLKL